MKSFYPFPISPPDGMQERNRPVSPVLFELM